MCRAQARRYVRLTKPLSFSFAALGSNGAENSLSIFSRKQGLERVAQDSLASPAAFQDRLR